LLPQTGFTHLPQKAEYFEVRKMATAIALSSDNSPNTMPPPDCDQASCCYWFEKIGTSSARCANRDSMVCRKRRDDVFSPYLPKNSSACK